MVKNPVMFVVGSRPRWSRSTAVANVTGLQPVRGCRRPGLQVQIAVWLWFTALFATYAEAVAEARGQGQAAACDGPLGSPSPIGAWPDGSSKRTSARPSCAKAT